MDTLARWSPQMLAILRIMAALLFIEHGTMKLFDFPPSLDGGADPLPPLMLAAALIELVGGALLAIGLFTRSVAFICAGQMAVAYFMAHAPQSFWPGLNGGDASILFCFIFLYLVCAGGGAWSVDALRRRSDAG